MTSAILQSSVRSFVLTSKDVFRQMGETATVVAHRTIPIFNRLTENAIFHLSYCTLLAVSHSVVCNQWLAPVIDSLVKGIIFPLLPAHVAYENHLKALVDGVCNGDLSAEKASRSILATFLAFFSQPKCLTWLKSYMEKLPPEQRIPPIVIERILSLKPLIDLETALYESSPIAPVSCQLSGDVLATISVMTKFLSSPRLTAEVQLFHRLITEATGRQIENLAERTDHVASLELRRQALLNGKIIVEGEEVELGVSLGWQGLHTAKHLTFETKDRQSIVRIWQHPILPLFEKELDSPYFPLLQPRKIAGNVGFYDRLLPLTDVKYFERNRIPREAQIEAAARIRRWFRFIYQNYGVLPTKESLQKLVMDEAGQIYAISPIAVQPASEQVLSMLFQELCVERWTGFAVEYFESFLRLAWSPEAFPESPVRKEHNLWLERLEKSGGLPPIALAMQEETKVLVDEIVLLFCDLEVAGYRPENIVRALSAWFKAYPEVVHTQWKQTSIDLTYILKRLESDCAVDPAHSRVEPIVQSLQQKHS